MSAEPTGAIVEYQAVLQFDKLLSEASAAFIRAAAPEIDSEIERWLGRFSTALGIQKAVLVQIDHTDGRIRATHQWAPGDVSPSILATASEDYPWLISKMRSGELVVLDDVDEAPSEATVDLREAHRRGGRAAVSVPLKIGGEIAGAVAFASAVKRKWTAETVGQLQRITEIFGIALERQQSQAVIRKLREESQNVLRVVPMAEVTASLAHELNQPLGAILNNAHAARRLLNTKPPDIEEVKDAVEGIIRDVGRVTNIVRHTREAFQSLIQEKAPVDVGELLLDLERLLRNDAKARGIFLRVDVRSSLPAVVANRQGLIQVLMNLVLNSFDSVSEFAEGAKEVDITADHDATDVHIKVRDTGKGIDPLIRPRLFNAFATTKPKGTGMGLAIARSVIEKNGGCIWAHHQTAPGATIEFTLPVEV